MKEPQSWRELLADIINNPKEKQHLAEELGVRAITLSRWAEAESEPRPQNLRHLLDALPQHRDQLATFLKQEKGLEAFSDIMKEDNLLEIPSYFYAEAIKALATVAPNLRLRSFCELVLRHALKQLDPEQQGMAIWVITCMPPSGSQTPQLVQSLREHLGFGTPPWNSDLGQRGMFLGAESLAGVTIMTAHEQCIHDVSNERALAASRDEHEKSCAAFPIFFVDRIAAILSLSSTQPNHFKPQSRLNLIESFTQLLALVFDDHEFYDSDQIRLVTMPSQHIQRTYFNQYLELSLEIIEDHARKHNPLNTIQAEQATWQRIESMIIADIEREERLKA